MSIDFLVSRIFFLKSLIKLFCLKSYNAIIVIFGIYRVDLHNRILISTWLDDLHFSASSTVRPKLLRPLDRPRFDLGGSPLVWGSVIGWYSYHKAPEAAEQYLYYSAQASGSPLFSTIFEYWSRGMRNSNWGQSCMYMIEDCDFYNFLSRMRLWLEVICGSHCLSISSSSLIRNSSTPDQWKFISLHSCKIFCTIMWKWAELTVERKERTLEWNFLSWCLCTFFQFGNSAAQYSNTDFIVRKIK